MRTVRIVDRGSAQQHGLAPSPGRDVARRDDPGKPSVEEKRSYYWNGPGWLAAYNEARRLMSTGLSAERAAPQVGWTKEDLEDAIRRDGRPPDHDPNAVDDFRPRERPRRTVKQRVAGLHGVSQNQERLARRLYEVEIMTVREVAKAIGEPYEKTYLILIRAGTKFRRPGRRGAADASAVKSVATLSRVVRDREPDDEPHDARKETRVRPSLSGPHPDKAKRTPPPRPDVSEAEKAMRRVLGRSAAPPVRRRSSTGHSSPHKKMSEAEKAMRRVLG